MGKTYVAHLALGHEVPKRGWDRLFGRKARSSLFGKLVRAAAFHGLHPAGAALHEDLFRKWLSLSLDAQKADLELYFSSPTGQRWSRLDMWLRMGQYCSVIPPEAKEAERKLFLGDMAVLAEALRGEGGSEYPGGEKGCV